ncbi:hypothetical protein HWD31_gp52 [Pantoea phage vB_PagM_SSEM1]|uniref:Uncharacterized protein n=1 Tax=Pantoea phage vB_PagM_SSEM1 TaxID=2721760 RepID=A0A6H0D9U2_9CAUD|nr:hypothetical protein HWD31_gp52 [Pantoea phage vB_PagM_SSEM1]QIS79361.1 hypothetical protein SSEM1_gp52 [Pantoea phage vB_PagM_SSEM1]
MNRNSFPPFIPVEDIATIRDEFARIIVGKVIDADGLSAIIHNQVSAEQIAKAVYFMADELMKARIPEPLKVNIDSGTH